MIKEVGYTDPSFLSPSSLRLLVKLAGNPALALLQLAQENGTFVRLNVGKRPVFLLSDPDDIRDVLIVNAHQFYRANEGAHRIMDLLHDGLLTIEGEAHRSERRLLQPAFHRQRISSYADTMVALTDQLSKRWRDHTTIDMTRNFSTLTLRIVAKTLYDADLDETTCVRLMEAMRLFSAIDILPFGKQIDQLPLPINRKLRAARDMMDTLCFDLIARRRAEGGEHHDLLAMLFEVQAAEPTRMDDEQMRNEMLSLFLAGHDTTAAALSWLWYLLAQHPEFEARFHAELDTVLNGRMPKAEDLPNLRYTEMLLAETLRLYPPAWSFARRAREDYQLRGATIPAGSTVIMSQFVVHHDPRWYPDPFKFDPERWTSDARNSRPKFAFFPFSGGQHICIGEHFVWMEGVLIMATLGQRWQASVAQGHKVVPQAGITLKPRNGLPMTLQRRLKPAHAMLTMPVNSARSPLPVRPTPAHTSNEPHHTQLALERSHVAHTSSVRRATRREIPLVTRILVDAFQHDPMFQYVIPSAEQRARILPILFQLNADYAHRFGEVYLNAEHTAALLWLPSDRAEMTAWRLLRTGLITTPLAINWRILWSLLATTDQMAKQHARLISRPHWYLSQIGVVSAYQGQGIGGNVLRPLLARLDADRLPCYLETPTAANVTFYQRYGFDVVATQLPTNHGKPGVWSMIREPR